MLQPVYITHSVAIAPQNTFEQPLLSPVVTDKDGKLHCTEPDYTTVIPPMQLRRMDRILKMSIYCGIKCLEDAGITRPDGIITATGKGNMTATEKFVKELAQYHEQALNPTPFILSTYNAVNGAIALQTQAKGYNQTFVHRGSSFELALYDTQLKLNESPELQRFLVGSFDEITDEYFFIKNKIGYWKKDRDYNLPLWQQSNSPGTIAGEGAAFFTLTNAQTKNALVIHQVQCITGTDTQRIQDVMNNLLQKAAWQPDLLLLGLNGNVHDEPYYHSVLSQFPASIPVMAFKHLCGEYETSGSYALWQLLQYLQGRPLPEAVWYRDMPQVKPARILYYNHFYGRQHNIILLEHTGA